MTFKHDAQVGGNHYAQGDKPQHWDLATMYQWDPFQYQITKYVMRWKDKHHTPEKKLEDLKKARSFLDKYIVEYEAWLPKVEVTTTSAESSMLNGLKYGYDSFNAYELASARYISDSYFLCEGGYGNGANVYTCLRCRTKVNARGLQEAHQEHGACPCRGYVAQG